MVKYKKITSLSKLIIQNIENMILLWYNMQIKRYMNTRGLGIYFDINIEFNNG